MGESAVISSHKHWWYELSVAVSDIWRKVKQNKSDAHYWHLTEGPCKWDGGI